MHHHYNDIRSRIPQDPTWWDEHAVPRYDPFEPTAVADIYASEAVLAEIACQACDRRFKVAFSRGDYHSSPPLSMYALAGELHYGDPPNVWCCPAGATMNSRPIRVLEFWERTPDYMDWKRRPDCEIAQRAKWDV